MKNMAGVALALVFLMSYAGISEAAALKQPKITALEGQTKEQQEKDTWECRDIAIKKTGVDPALLEMQMKTQSSMLGQKAMPVSVGGKDISASPLSPSQYSEAKKSGDKMKGIKDRYKLWVDAFSEEMASRGYKVK